MCTKIKWIPVSGAETNINKLIQIWFPYPHMHTNEQSTSISTEDRFEAVFMNEFLNEYTFSTKTIIKSVLENIFPLCQITKTKNEQM